MLPHLAADSAAIESARAGLDAAQKGSEKELEVRRFLNRMLGLPLAQQRQRFRLSAAPRYGGRSPDWSGC